ncbi:gamma-glutamylcyclotransferase family protein [Chengkuizengella axinellae]|uniref:Gamma-glutamylcyclotransferase family protein n=1 Tax=Chengkuizengella axinellae TaxID=3064388 RepID=A0ABT9J1W5_9BACL|nr:gamma-glutamylcyclotransferase family protein [Chengkuizengella sp. 2205SS18-9]MDP5275604.1 gamma-glutamylcyclotransferase family protein [Chengkuizengella sp. 2205SS18-9]
MKHNNLKIESDKSYYFAYGSCMNQSSFKGTVPQYEVVGKAELIDYRVAFTRESDKWGKGGVADIIKTSNHIMEGVLYLIPNNLIPNLDLREGASQECINNVYQKIKVKVIYNNKLLDAFTYEVIHKEDFEIAPSERYKNAIIGGTDVLSSNYSKKLIGHMNKLQKESS